MYQHVEIIGRLGRDPETRYTQGGEMVCSFSVATDKKWVKDEQKYEKTTWFKVATWGKLAEICDKYLTKGSLVFLSGEMNEPRPYQAKDGTWKCALDMTAHEMKMLNSKQGAAEQGDEAVKTEDADEVLF